MMKCTFEILTGPAVGAALYEAGGFMLPFLSVGSVSTLLSFMLIFTIPNLTASHGNGVVANGDAVHNGDVPNGAVPNGHAPGEHDNDPLLQTGVSARPVLRKAFQRPNY